MEEVKRDVLGWSVDSILDPETSKDAWLTRVPTRFKDLEQYSKIFWRLFAGGVQGTCTSGEWRFLSLLQPFKILGLMVSFDLQHEWSTLKDGLC